MRGWGLGIVAALVLGTGVAAQDAGPSPVLIIDSERLYLESEYGQRLRTAMEDEARALQAENDQIQAQLIEEERSLTLRRPNMSVEDFRAEAEAFDTKVQEIRRARDAKIAALEQAQVDGRDQFFADVRGIVGRLMLERGAVVLMDRRSVFLALGSADLTAAAIARIDAELTETPDVPAPALPEDGLIAPAEEDTLATDP